MTLRTRLIIVIALLMVTYVVTALVVISTQRTMLIEQVDRRISALPPGLIEPRQQQTGVEFTEAGQAGSGQPPESPFSEMYIGYFGTDGTRVDLIVGSLLNSTPDIAAAVDAAGGDHRIVTVGSSGSAVRFRAAVLPQEIAGTYLISAQPLTETDAAIARLERTLGIAGIVIAVVLGTAFFWVQRLGLRPIARITAAAELISAGDRAHRVDLHGTSTEAGKLGQAFNVMLDERDAGEARLRQFVADASHELRTPLTSVRGYLELYRQGAFREPKQLDDVVRRLSAEAARMNGLVDDLFALSSLDEGRPHRREPVDVGQLLRDLAQDARASQVDRQIELNLPPAGPMMTGDSALLIQLGGVLVANALAHTPVDGPITLSAEEAGEVVTIVVADSGPGLEQEAAAHVFDRFWRGDTGRGRSKGNGYGHQSGSGLGLSIAKSITERHGGTIALETAPGAGCTFTVRLPRIPDDATSNQNQT